jgi:hypothetical protein
LPMPSKNPKKSAKPRKRAVSKNAGEIPGAKEPALIPQSHGGALYSGGVPGHRGGTGRPPSEIRRIAREAWADRIPFLTEIADGVVPIRLAVKCEHCGKEPTEGTSLEELVKLTPEVTDRLRAMDQLAKVGIGANKELTVEHIRERLSEQIQRIQNAFPPEVAEQIIGVIEPVWSK